MFKPKSPGKPKSPLKAATASGYEDVSDDENVEEEENTTYFTPVIPLPDKVEVKTGEENETVLYSHRAKLFRFKDSEWRERGLGDVKILQHKTTGKMRVVMRREQIFKICLNHVLDHDIEYKQKDDKSWHFVVNDFSEGAIELEQLCLRFKTPEISEEFKKAIDDALSGVSSKQNGGGSHHEPENRQTLQSKLSAEEEKKITDLKLPPHFFAYKDHTTCSGCRGCASEEFVFPEVKTINLGVTDENPLPLYFSPIVPSNNLSKAPQSSKPNVFASLNTPQFGAKSEVSTTTPKSSFFFGGGGNLNTSASLSFGNSSSAEKFPSEDHFKGPLKFEKTEQSPAPAEFSFGNSSLFGGKFQQHKI